MVLLAEIAMICFGIYALSTGRLPIGRGRIVRGSNARLLGIVALLPIPLAFLFAFIVGTAILLAGGNAEAAPVTAVLTISELAIVVACAVAILLVGHRLAPNASESMPPSVDVGNPTLTHSAIGVAAFVLAVFAILAIGGLTVVGAALDPSSLSRPDQDATAIEVVLGIFLMIACCTDLVSVGLGIVALFQQNRRKGYAVAALTLGATGLFLLLLLFAAANVATAPG